MLNGKFLLIICSKEIWKVGVPRVSALLPMSVFVCRLLAFAFIELEERKSLD